MAGTGHRRVPPGTPAEVAALLDGDPRVPRFDPTLGIAVDVAHRGTPPHRLVVLGDSLSAGFQSGAVYATDLSWPAIVADELGWGAGFRRPHYGGPGGLPLNLEFLLRDLERRVGTDVHLWDPRVALGLRSFLDSVEDWWERGPGAVPPPPAPIRHCLAVYDWDLRDALSRTGASCAARIGRPRDDLLAQLVQDDTMRAALRVYPDDSAAAGELTLLGAAAALGLEGGDEAADGDGIETLVVFLGANNALRVVTDLRVTWSEDGDADGRGGYRDLEAKNAFTVWRPSHFRAELAELVEAVAAVGARHVIWCTVPHVTIAPLARGVGTKVVPGSRYFPYYTRPWVTDAAFDPTRDQHVTADEARVVDAAIDAYNDAIEQAVATARTGRAGPAGQEPRDWYLLDIAGQLDRLASRRYVEDPSARPAWWTPYPLPGTLTALTPVPDSHFLTADGRGGRAGGGLFSLDGVHPTTVAYGLVAQEVVTVMQRAGVVFRRPDGAVRPGPVTVDMARLLERDTLVRHPPQSLDPALRILGALDDTVGWVARALGVSFDV